MDPALLIAAASFALAAASLGWQVATWLMDGRRIRVSLVHGIIKDGAVYAGKVGRDGAPRDLNSLRVQGIDGTEVVGIAVTNLGRAPVRVDGYSIKLAKGGVSFTPIGEAIGPGLPFRLPPGETEAWYARMDDARRLVQSVRGIGKPASSEVRATVKVGTGDEKATRRTLHVA